MESKETGCDTLTAPCRQDSFKKGHDDGDHLLGLEDGVFTYLSVPRLDSKSVAQGKKLCFVDHRLERWDPVSVSEMCCRREAGHVHAHIHNGDITEDVLLEQCMEEAGCCLPMLRDMGSMRASMYSDGDGEYDIDHEHQEGCGHNKIKHGDHFDWLIPLEDGSFVLSHVEATSNGGSQFIEHGRLVKVGESLGQLKRRRNGGKDLVDLFTYEPRRKGYEILPATEEDDLPGMIEPNIVTIIKSPSHGCIALSAPSDAVVLSIPRNFKPQDLTKTVFDVMGICCPSEVPIVKKILEPVAGVDEVIVNAMAKTVTVQHDPKVVTDVHLVKLLNEARLDASIHQRGQKRSAHRWPSPYTIGSGALLAVALFYYIYDPLKWVALGAIAVGLPPIVVRSMVALKQWVLDINALMLIAVGGAIALGDYVEAGSIVFLFTLADWLESRSSDKAQQAITNVAELAPQTAVLMDGQRVDVNDVQVGTLLAVKAGELIPIDGEVVSGKSSIDESNVTGESLPVEKTLGATVWAGTMNLSGYISMKTTAVAEDSAVSRMVRLVEEAQNQHSPTEQFVSKVAKYYTPLVIVAALGVVVIPLAAGSDRHRHWIYLALVLLVVACPCALVISTPVATTCGIAQAARSGLLVRGGTYLEALAKVKILAVDKTGTLTEGHFRVLNVQSVDSGTTTREVLYWIACVENKSSHPLAPALVAYARLQGVEAGDNVSDFEIIPGLGVAATVDGQLVQIGNGRLASTFVGMEDGHPEVIETWNSQGATVGWVGVNGRVVGIFGVADSVRVDSVETVAQLKNLGVRIVMLTGDSSVAAKAVQGQIGDIEVHAELLPEHKVALVRELKESGTTAMVGDGINDAPALALADVGIAMGVAGSAVAMETADVALMTNDLRKIAVAIKLGQDVRRKIIQNVGLSFSLKIAIIILAAAGKPSLWAAVITDVGTCLAVIFNSMRLLHRKKGIVLPKFESKKSHSQSQTVQRCRNHECDHSHSHDAPHPDHQYLEVSVIGGTANELHQELGKIEDRRHVCHGDNHVHQNEQELTKVTDPVCCRESKAQHGHGNDYNKHEDSSWLRTKSGHCKDDCRNVKSVLDRTQQVNDCCKSEKALLEGRSLCPSEGLKACCIGTRTTGDNKCCGTVTVDDYTKKKDVCQKVCGTKDAEKGCFASSNVSLQSTCCRIGSELIKRSRSGQEQGGCLEHRVVKSHGSCASSKSCNSSSSTGQRTELQSCGGVSPKLGNSGCCDGKDQKKTGTVPSTCKSKCCKGQGEVGSDSRKGMGPRSCTGQREEKHAHDGLSPKIGNSGCCDEKDQEKTGNVASACKSKCCKGQGEVGSDSRKGVGPRSCTGQHKENLSHDGMGTKFGNSGCGEGKDLEKAGKVSSACKSKCCKGQAEVWTESGKGMGPRSATGQRKEEHSHDGVSPKSGNSGRYEGKDQEKTSKLPSACKSKCCKGQGEIGTGSRKAVGPSVGTGSCCQGSGKDRKCHQVEGRSQDRQEALEQTGTSSNTSREKDSGRKASCPKSCCKDETQLPSSRNSQGMAQEASCPSNSMLSVRAGPPCCSTVGCPADGVSRSESIKATADVCSEEAKVCDKTTSACDLGKCKSTDHRKCRKEALAHSPLRDLSSLGRPIAPL